MNRTTESDSDIKTSENPPAADQQLPGVRLRVDERELVTSYANAFRTHATLEELMLDFGINTVQPTPAPGSAGGDGSQPEAEVILRTSNRIIMNYFTAKRLAITLSQAIRQYEIRFGEIELDSSERVRTANH